MEDEKVGLASMYAQIEEEIDKIATDLETLPTEEAKDDAYTKVSKLDREQREIGDDILDKRVQQKLEDKYRFWFTVPLRDKQNNIIGKRKVYHSPELDRILVKSSPTNPSEAGFNERMQILHNAKAVIDRARSHFGS